MDNNIPRSVVVSVVVVALVQDSLVVGQPLAVIGVAVNDANLHPIFLIEYDGGCVSVANVPCGVNWKDWIVWDAANTLVPLHSCKLVCVVGTIKRGLEADEVFLLNLLLAHTAQPLHVDLLVGHHRLSVLSLLHFLAEHVLLEHDAIPQRSVVDAFCVCKNIGASPTHVNEPACLLCVLQKPPSVILCPWREAEQGPPAVLGQDWADEIPSSRVLDGILRDNHPDWVGSNDPIHMV